MEPGPSWRRWHAIQSLKDKLSSQKAEDRQAPSLKGRAGPGAEAPVQEAASELLSNGRTKGLRAEGLPVRSWCVPGSP